MPFVYFGYKPRDKGATKLVVSTPAGEFEPAEPSSIKIFAFRTFTPLWSSVVSLIGLVVAVLSYPINSYVHTTATGLFVNPAGNLVLPFRSPGLSVALHKGKTIPQTESDKLEEMGFSTMSFSGRTLWIKEQADAADFRFANTLTGIDITGPTPARYLNMNSFKAYLVLRSLTTRICEATHFLSGESGQFAMGKQHDASKLKKPWLNLLRTEKAGEDTVMEPTAPEFEKLTVYDTKSLVDRRLAGVIRLAGTTDGTSCLNSGVVMNPFEQHYAGLISAGDIKSLKSHGLILKFNHRLALPDPNYIGDVIGRRFLAALGETIEDQSDGLMLLKTGLSGLRLTRCGDELTHLYRCLDVALDCYSGCIPIFSEGGVYEGCVISGGPGATITLNGQSFPFLPLEQLKSEFLNVSEHTIALNFIKSLIPSDDAKARIGSVTSMTDLRALIINLPFSSDDRDSIIRKAAHLNFFVSEPWSINPNNISRCMSLISDFSTLDASHPISRLALFSGDKVLVALSCFGEKSVPSWDIPNGTKCRLVKPNPPTPLVNTGKKGSKGEISDAAWIMVIRTTDLFSATDEFRRMADDLTYRSTSSMLAKKNGHRVFSRDRMAEFWGPLREALKTVNPKAQFEEEDVSKKRGATDSMDAVPVESTSGKRRRLEF